MTRARSISRKWLLLLPLVAVLVVAVACGDDATPTPTATTSPTATALPAASPTPGSVAATATPTQEAAMEKPGFVDPIELAARYGDKPRVGGLMVTGNFENWPHYDYQQGVGANWTSQAQLNAGLMMTNPYDWTELMPDIAYKWEVSDDFQTYTFFLHEGVTFADGTEVDSETFRYGMERIRTKGVFPDDPEAKETCPACKAVVVDALIKEFRAPEKYVFEIVTEGPSSVIPTLLSNSYYSAFPKHRNEIDRDNEVRDNLRPLGAGPFMMAEDASPTLWVEEKNPNYFKPGLPYVDGWEIHLILDVETRATAVVSERIFMNHTTSAPFLPFETAKAMAGQDPGIIHVPNPSWLFMFWAFYVENPILSDIRVRRALSLAVDRSVLVAEDTFHGTEGLGQVRGVIGTSIFPESPWAPPLEVIQGYTGYGPDMDARRAEAMALIADYEAENGEIDWSQAPYSCATNHPSCDNATLIQDQVKKIGVELKLEPGEIITSWQKMVDSDFAMGGMLGLIDFDDPIAYPAKHWLDGAEWAHNRSVVQEAEDLYGTGLFLTAESDRREWAWEVDRLFMEDASMNVMWWAIGETIHRDYVKGWTGHPDGWGTNARGESMYLDHDELPFAS